MDVGSARARGLGPSLVFGGLLLDGVRRILRSPAGRECHESSSERRVEGGEGWDSANTVSSRRDFASPLVAVKICSLIAPFLEYRDTLGVVSYRGKLYVLQIEIVDIYICINPVGIRTENIEVTSCRISLILMEVRSEDEHVRGSTIK